MNLLYDGPAHSRLTLVLAHGAGAPMDSPFMNRIAQGVGGAAIRVVRFEFPYMEAARHSGKRTAPDREPVLRATWQLVIEHLGGAKSMVIGGKSMGGRIASLIADEAGAAGLVCLGYPFHSPGHSSHPRIDHLRGLTTPTLILQGTRDSLGNRDEVSAYTLSPRIRLVWIESGDHSLKPLKRSSRTEEENLTEAVSSIVEFIKELARHLP